MNQERKRTGFNALWFAMVAYLGISLSRQNVACPMLYLATGTGFAVAALLLAFRFIAYSDEWHRTSHSRNDEGTLQWKAKRFLWVISSVIAVIIVISEIIKWLRE